MKDSNNLITVYDVPVVLFTSCYKITLEKVLCTLLSSQTITNFKCSHCPKFLVPLSYFISTHATPCQTLFAGHQKIVHYSSSYFVATTKWNCRLAIMNRVLEKALKSECFGNLALFAFNSAKIENKFSVHHISSSPLNDMCVSLAA